MTLYWKPDPARVEQANMTRFMASTGHATYQSLYEWSIAAPEEFWPALWKFSDIQSSAPWSRVVDDKSKMPGARWFEGARLNFAENLLRFRDQRIALSFLSERGDSRELTFAALYDEVEQVAGALAALGVKAGDRIAGFLPNIPEAVVAMLAAASLGAIWSSSSPDFGEKGVLDRFGQIEPTVLFAIEGYTYGGKPVDLRGRLENIVAALPSLKKTVTIPYAGNHGNYDAFKASGAGRPLRFEQLPFDHPLYIMYSSGTTGVPKCIVHGAGGTLLQHAKELLLHTDLKREDRIFYFTTCGWMMWNWLVSSLAAGATVMLYDGSPTHPSADVLWQWADRARISIFGTSAKYLSAIEKAGVVPRTHNLSALRTVLSTGSPLLPESYDFVYRDIRADVCLSSISGGTDIISCFALGNPILPVHRGELQCRGLGMKVEVLSEEGEPLRGEKGELCCTMAFPSMPVAFWNDPDGGRYHASYFEKFPGIWCHGDWAALTQSGGMIIYGRSDATLNPGGVRIGTAEIYRVVEQVPTVVESLAVGHQRDGDVEVILFVVLQAGATLDAALESAIRTRLKGEASPRHVPAKIFQVPAIPRTLSGKITELAVQKILRGEAVKNQDALANPEALDAFRAIKL